MGLLSFLFYKKEPHPVIRWSKTLGARRTPDEILERAMNNVVCGHSDTEVALAEMSEYVLTDLSLSVICRNHNLTTKDVGDLFSSLRQHGAGQWIQDVYIPVMAMCWPGTLDFVIRKFRDGSHDDAISGSARLIEYFTKKEKGILRPDGSILSLPTPDR